MKEEIAGAVVPLFAAPLVLVGNSGSSRVRVDVIGLPRLLVFTRSITPGVLSAVFVVIVVDPGVTGPVVRITVEASANARPEDPPAPWSNAPTCTRDASRKWLSTTNCPLSEAA